MKKERNPFKSSEVKKILKCSNCSVLCECRPELLLLCCSTLLCCPLSSLRCGPPSTDTPAGGGAWPLPAASPWPTSSGRECCRLSLQSVNATPLHWNTSEPLIASSSLTYSLSSSSSLSFFSSSSCVLFSLASSSPLFFPSSIFSVSPVLLNFLFLHLFYTPLPSCFCLAPIGPTG